MTALIDVDDVRAHIETDKTDAALEQLIDDADAEIVARFGVHTAAITETITPGTTDRFVFTQRPISALTSVTEDDVVLTASDYDRTGLMSLERVDGYWGTRVVLVYTPVSDDARRVRVSIDLVRLALAYDAIASGSAGDVSVNHVASYQAERESLLTTLQTSFLGSFA